MSNKLTVQVIGNAYSGKSTVCKLIEQALKEKGFTVTINLLDGDNVLNVDERTDVLVNDRATHITIEEISAQRESGV